MADLTSARDAAVASVWRVCVLLRSASKNCFRRGITSDEEKETTYDCGVSLFHSSSRAFGFVTFEPSLKLEGWLSDGIGERHAARVKI